MSYENWNGRSVDDADVRGSTSLENLTVDELVNDYNAFAKKSSENVLGLATTILRVDDLDRRSDQERFYEQVKLDPKGSTVRKLRVIGEKLPKFQPFLSIIPNTWTTLYVLAKLEDEEYRAVIDSGVLHPFVTLREIEEVQDRASTTPSVKFPLHLNLYRIATPRRQAEFYRKLKALVEEFEIDLEPMAPKREKQLSSLLDEFDEQKQAA